MQLTYRGIRYNSTISTAITDSTAIQKTARYRGHFYSLKCASHSNNALDFNLRFLGKTYRKTVCY